MNNMRYLPILYMLLNLTFIKGAVGCMDNSKHLQERFDTKEYAFVECDCGCTKMLPDGKTCFSCGHVRIPPKMEILDGAAQHAEKTTKRASGGVLDYFVTPRAIMKQLIEQRNKAH